MNAINMSHQMMNIKDNNIFNIYKFIFDNTEHEIRTLYDNDSNPWFVGSDIAKALGYKNPGESLNIVVKNNNKMTYTEFALKNKLSKEDMSKKIMYNASLINESGLYRLANRSNKQIALEFQDWICEIVIPSIRKYGVYRIIKEKDDKINELINKIDNQTNQITNLGNQIINLSAQNNQIINQNNNLENKIDVITEHMVDNIDRANLKEQFLIVQILDQPEEQKFQYYRIRAQKRNINRAIEDLRLKYKIDNIADKIIMRINYIPNSVMFNNKIRDNIEGVYIKSHLNGFNLINGHTIEEKIKYMI